MMTKSLYLQKGFGLIGIIIVVAIIAVLGGGGLYFRELKQRQSFQQIGIETIKKAEELKKKIEGGCGPQPPAICGDNKILQCVNNTWQCGEPAKSEIDTSTWKTYRNEKYGFEFAYPDEFSVWQSEDYTVAGIPVTRGGVDSGIYRLAISGLRKRENLTVDQFIHNNATYQQSSNQYQNEGSDQINGIKTYWYTILLGSGNTKNYFFLRDNNNGVHASYYGIYGGVDNPFSKKFDQILSTFKFIK